MKKIKVKSNLYDYDVNFITNVQEQLANLGKERCTYIIDKNIYKLYNHLFEEIVEENIFLVDAVESEKNIDTIIEVIAFWKKLKVRKNWKVVCFGGGITQDIATFACNIYLRNIDWYFFPTTLLAMCDSCIGGKCGINFNDYKNQLGVFYPPKKIFIYDSFLNTLSKQDYINGWGELLKFSLTEDKAFYDKLVKEEKYIPCDLISDYIYKGLLVKKNIIEEDEFEGDLRRVLNFGHTFGHALEAYTYNRIPHGTAVIWGIDVVNYISCRIGVLRREVYLDIKKLIKESFISEEINIDEIDRFFDILSTDKKVKDNTVYLVLLERLSQLGIYPMKLDDELIGFFADYLEETHEYYCY